VCRTDLHIVDGQLKDVFDVDLAYTLGHETAGWIQEVGSNVRHLSVGDAVILHPLGTCGYCPACRNGNDMHCTTSTFPGVNIDGGMADVIRVNARSLVRLADGIHPRDVAALADAGLTAYHAVKKAVSRLTPGTSAAVIGCGGLGHIAIQLLRSMTADLLRDRLRRHSNRTHFGPRAPRSLRRGEPCWNL
jgi:NAD+-dependent secondary alcohol dehydrogenase Adh1